MQIALGRPRYANIHCCFIRVNSCTSGLQHEDLLGEPPRIFEAWDISVELAAKATADVMFRTYV
jgi:hypothetical protein